MNNNRRNGKEKETEKLWKMCEDRLPRHSTRRVSNFTSSSQHNSRVRVSIGPHDRDVERKKKEEKNVSLFSLNSPDSRLWLFCSWLCCLLTCAHRVRAQALYRAPTSQEYCIDSVFIFIAHSPYFTISSLCRSSKNAYFRSFLTQQTSGSEQ